MTMDSATNPKYRVAVCLVLAVIAAALIGCPRKSTPPAQFTSADIASIGMFTRFSDDALGAPEEGDGEGATREVTEPDVIRRDGNLLYVLNQFRGLTVVDLDEQRILGQAPTHGFPRDLYLEGNRAYVLVGQARDFAEEDGLVTATMQSRLYVLDVADPTAPLITATFDLQGDLSDSRLVGDVLYAVGVEYTYYYYGPDQDDAVIRKQGPATWITSVNIADIENPILADQLRFDGQGTVIHATSEAIYAAAPSFARETTDITIIDISDPGGAMTISGVASVRGYVADRFKLDAWNGALRVVTSVFQGGLQVYVTTIDLATLETLAELRLEDAEGDTLFATRFDGPLAYVVTYFVIDPLFVIDLADPANPLIREPLEVPGYSIHIEPRGDRLYALGVDDTAGQRVGVSIFDVSGDPIRLDHVSFGEDWSWSSAFHDVRALTILDDLIIVPFSGWNADFGGFERLQFISHTRDTLELNGYVDLDGGILRSFEYGPHHYGVTSEQLARIDASDPANPQVISALTLAENLVDFADISPGLAVEVIQRYTDGQTILRTVDAALNPIGELFLDIGGFTDLFVTEDRAILVGIAWDENPRYEVAIVDTTGDLPILVQQLALDVHPFYGYFYFGPFPIEPFLDGPLRGKSIRPPGPVDFGAGDRGFVLDGVLALRCFTEDVDTVFGEGQVNQALALIDINEAAWTSTVGLAHERITSIDAVGNSLFLGTKTDVGTQNGQPLCAHFIRELDVLNGIEGPAANVPGVFMQFDAQSRVLTLRDHQWGQFGAASSSLETVRWDGSNTVEHRDSFPLPEFAGEIAPAGDRLYITTHGQGFALRELHIGAEGQITQGAAVTITNTWAWLLGANGPSAYVTVAGGAVAHYDFTNGGVLAELIEVMGAPHSIRFGAENAYAPAGYFGLVILPL